jgi:LPXTG-site transpeptidase (sortase) family protein
MPTPGSSTVAPPSRLVIPRINVDAPIEDVGIASNGDLQTPTKNPWDGAGWYSNGPRPGESGSAVINGHLDRPGGYPATFWNLRDLTPGDTVMVLDAQGKTHTFRVLRVASYDPQQAPLQEIFGTTGGTFLNLITCAGTWIPAQHQTTLRLVVYTQAV